MTEPDTSAADGGVERIEMGGGGEAEPPGAGGTHETITRPVVLPETFDGTSSWSEWTFHFENIASVNGWDSTLKLKWLQVHLTGRAHQLYRMEHMSVYQLTPTLHTTNRTAGRFQCPTKISNHTR